MAEYNPKHHTQPDKIVWQAGHVNHNRKLTHQAHWETPAEKDRDAEFKIPEGHREIWHHADGSELHQYYNDQGKVRFSERMNPHGIVARDHDGAQTWHQTPRITTTHATNPQITTTHATNHRTYRNSYKNIHVDGHSRPHFGNIIMNGVPPGSQQAIEEAGRHAEELAAMYDHDHP